MQRDWIVEGEYRRAIESLWLEGKPSRANVERVEYDGNIIDQGFGEDCGECGECVLHTGKGVHGENEYGAERFDMPLNIPYNTLLTGLILLDIVGAGKLRRVEDTNLVRRLCLLTPLK